MRIRSRITLSTAELLQQITAETEKCSPHGETFQPGEAVINTDPNGDGIQDIEIAEFTDPLTHLAYRSVAFDDADHSIGVQMLQEASDFVAGPWQDAQDALATANAGVDEAAKRAARIGVQRADAKLNEKVQVIDFNVYLGDIFQFPGG